MKVMIINPPNIWDHVYTARSQNRWLHSRPKGQFFSEKIYPTYPLLLTYAGAELERAQFQVKIIDAAFQDLSYQELCKKALKFKPDLVVFEIASNSLNVDMKTVKHIRDTIPHAHLTVIGTHATAFPEDVLKEYPYLDSVVCGEFFITLRVLAETLQKNSDLSSVNGLVYRNRNHIIKNNPRPMIKNLDDLPLPARHLVPPDEYYLGHYTYKPQVMMMSSMGCPNQCIFCLWPQTIGGNKYRPRNPLKIAVEMEHVIKDWGAKEIYFDDDTFNVSVEHSIGVCNEIIDRGLWLPWITQARVDNMPLELLKKMKQAGCIKILFGVESGSQHILDNIKKRITVEQVKKTFKLCRKVEIKTHATFMIGLPGETKGTIEESIDLAKQLNCDTIQVSVAQPFPGTPWHKQCIKEGTLKVTKWEDYDGELGGSHNVPGLSSDYIIESVGRFYKEFYLQPKHLCGRVLGIRSIADLHRLWGFTMGFIRRFSMRKIA
jgi:anaerobic magnesium-protoporphyrin IX monomethyl ester cyclase